MALHSSLFVVAAVLLVFVIVSTSGLQCHICGEYNDGQGSITPCLNYTESNAHLHLKECRRKTDKFCVKYVAQLSTVRDCVETCVEKEVWDTSTYCCNENGCNESSVASISKFLLVTSTLVLSAKLLRNKV